MQATGALVKLYGSLKKVFAGLFPEMQIKSGK
jgi:hypothetical protein